MKQEAKRREPRVRAFLLLYETCRAARLFPGDNAELGSLEELDDVSDLGAVGHLVDNLVDSVEERRAPVEDQTVSVGNVLQNLFIDSMLAAYGNIRTVVSFGTHKQTSIIAQIADTIGIELIGRYGAAFIIYVRSLYLRQHGHINACQSKGLYDIGAKLILRIGTPRNGDFQLFLIIVSACFRTCATEYDKYYGYMPNL